MKNRPNWLLPNRPYPKTGGRVENLVPGFKGPFCQAITKATGQKCKKNALKWSCYCLTHKGNSKRMMRARKYVQIGVPVERITERHIAQKYEYITNYLQNGNVE